MQDHEEADCGGCVDADDGVGWHHVAMTVKDNGDPVLYVDGVCVATGIGTGSSRTKRIGITIGGDIWGYFTGKIDDVCI